MRALVRGGNSPPGAVAIRGNALDRATFASQVAPSDTFIQLVGVAHPSPAKAQQFRDVDLSVAQPAPAMQAYVAVRAKGSGC